MSIIGVPLGYIMYFIYGFVNNYGLSLVLFVMLTKIALFPLGVNQQKNTAIMAKISKKQRDIAKKYSNNKEKMNEETMRLYEEEGYNPLSGCLPLFIQMPLLFGIIDVIYKPLKHILHIPTDLISACEKMLLDAGESKTSVVEINIINHIQAGTFSFESVLTTEMVESIKNFDLVFIGLNLGEVPSWSSILVLIPIISALTSLSSGILTIKIQEKNGQDVQPQIKSMMYFTPLISLWIGFTLPAGAGVYWTVSGFFQIIQQLLLQAIWPPDKVAEQSVATMEKNKAKMAKRREQAEKYNKMLEEQGKPVNKSLPRETSDEENEKSDKKSKKDSKKDDKLDDDANKRIAAARKRMQEKYGED